MFRYQSTVSHARKTVTKVTITGGGYGHTITWQSNCQYTKNSETSNRT